MDTQVRCPVCGSKLDEDAEACNVCNTAFEEGEPRCPLCDTVLSEDDDVCPECNAALEDGPTAETEPEASPEDAVPEDVPEDSEEVIIEETVEPSSSEVEGPPPEEEPEGSEEVITEETVEPSSSEVEEPPPEEEPEGSEEVIIEEAAEPSSSEVEEPPPEEGEADQEDAAPEGTGSDFITGIIGDPEATPETPDKAEDDEKHLVDAELENLVKLPGVGPLMAQILFDAGYTNLRRLKRATVIELMKIQGIGRKAAGEIKSALRETDLVDIRQQELTEEQVVTEYQCPLCSTIVSDYETSCYECGTVFNTDGDPEDSDRLALSYYDSKLLRTPDNPELWYARGATLMKMEDYDMALNSFDRALEINPEFQTAWVSKAEVYNKQGDPIKAAECYGHIITKSSKLISSGDGVSDDDTASTLQVTAEDVKDFEAELDEEPEAVMPPEEASVEGEPTPADEPAPEPEPLEETGPIEISDEKEPGSMPEPGDKPEPLAAQPPDEIRMDYTKSSKDKQFEGMSEKDLKGYLAKRATLVKPLLILAKETEVGISSAKRIISLSVAHSKKGELIEAVTMMNQGIETIEMDFKTKLSQDISYLAGAVRDLKVSGMDVSKAVDLITMAKEKVEVNEFKEAFNAMKDCLELVEKMNN